jgi:hypothetical protein
MLGWAHSESMKIRERYQFLFQQQSLSNHHLSKSAAARVAFLEKFERVEFKSRGNT